MLSQYKQHLKAQIEAKWATATPQGRVILMGEMALVLGSDIDQAITYANQHGWAGEPVLMALARALSQVT